MIRVYRDPISSQAYIEGVTEGYSYNYIAWDSGQDKVSIRNKNTGVEEVNRIDYWQVKNRLGDSYSSKQDLLNYLNNEVFIEGDFGQGLKVIDSASDIEQTDFYYYGYQYQDLSYKIVRAEKGNVNNQQKATIQTDFQSDWNNRSSLVY